MRCEKHPGGSAIMRVDAPRHFADRRAREELRVLKLVLEDVSRLDELIRATGDFARRSGTRRVALRLQGEYLQPFQRIIALGGHIRWTDLRMSLGGYEEKRPTNGFVLSNWEI